MYAPIRIFCSYAREDEDWLHKLENHLSPLRKQGLISLWHKEHLKPGVDRTVETRKQMEAASMILLLISANFFASEHCYDIEMKQALVRHKSGTACVIPILIRSVDWHETPLAHLQTLPDNGIPLEMWSNEDAAFASVVADLHQLLKDLSSHQISVSSGSLPEIWNIPYSRNPFFLGREHELAQIHTRLQAHRTATLSQPQAISGLGGIGKTQLAIEYAYRYHQDYHMVLWAHAENLETLSASYTEIAGLLTLPECEAQEQQVIILAVRKWLQTHQKWLLILDNADEPESLTAFLPDAPGGHLLITTRAADVSHLGLGFTHSLIVETFPPDEGLLFLLHRAGLLASDTSSNQVSLADRLLARQIGQEVGWLPLALDQVGAYIKATQSDLASYQRLFQQHRSRLLKERWGREHPDPVASTWSLSFQRVEQRNSAAADLLRLCAFLSADAIPEEILTDGASVLGPVLSLIPDDPFLLGQSIRTLGAYSLIGRNPQAGTLSIHRLVQAVLQDEMDLDTRKLWAMRAVCAVNKALLLVEHQTGIQRDRILPQALQCAELIKIYNLTIFEAGRLLNRTARYLREYGRYEEAEPLYFQALAICEQMQPEGKKTLIPLRSGKLDAAQGLRRQKVQDAEAEKETIWKKLINRPEDIVKEALAGMAVAHKDVISVLSEQDVVVRKDAPVKGKVGIISGGGSGHEPLHSGFVGVGMLDAACIGPLFTSPTEDQVLAATRAVYGGTGVLYIVKNYLGDKSNFLWAAFELAATNDIEIAVVFTNDDVGVEDEHPINRRGMGVNVILQKIVGGFAQTGASLNQVATLAEKVNANGRSIGVALTACVLPATGKSLFELDEDEITVGVGIHGQAGQSTIKWENAAEITERLIYPLIHDLGLMAGENVLVMVSGLGGTPLAELYIIFNAVKHLLDSKNIIVARHLVGNYITSLETAGCSLTLVRLDDELIRYWDAPVRTPSLRWGC